MGKCQLGKGEIKQPKLPWLRPLYGYIHDFYDYFIQPQLHLQERKIILSLFFFKLPNIQFRIVYIL